MGGREEQQLRNLISEDLTTEIKLVGTLAELRLDVKYLIISSYFSELVLEVLHLLSFHQTLSCDVAEGPSKNWELGDGKLILIHRLMVAWILVKK